MNVARQEIRTAVFVIVSLAILVCTLLYLGSPGVFVPMKTYWVFVDNAAGLQPGADVQLAGRRIGQVRRLYSPMPEETRPDKEKKLETLIEVRVQRSAEIYRDVRVSVTQNGLLGEILLDFASGSEEQGIAPPQYTFIGERAPGLNEAVPKVMNELQPAIEAATRTLNTLQKTAESIDRMAGKDGEVDKTVSEFKKFGIQLNELTGPDSSLRHSLANLEKLTGDGGQLDEALENINVLTDSDSALASTLKHTEQFTAKLSSNKDIYATLHNLRLTSTRLNYTLAELGGKFSTIGTNLEQATDTVKHQPWRLIWPTTKKYPEDKLKAATPAPTPVPVVKVSDPPSRKRR